MKTRAAVPRDILGSTESIGVLIELYNGEPC